MPDPLDLVIARAKAMEAKQGMGGTEPLPGGGAATMQPAPALAPAPAPVQWSPEDAQEAERILQSGRGSPEELQELQQMYEQYTSSKPEPEPYDPGPPQYGRPQGPIRRVGGFQGAMHIPGMPIPVPYRGESLAPSRELETSNARRRNAVQRTLEGLYRNAPGMDAEAWRQVQALVDSGLPERQALELAAQIAGKTQQQQHADRRASMSAEAQARRFGMKTANPVEYTEQFDKEMKKFSKRYGLDRAEASPTQRLEALRNAVAMDPTKLNSYGQRQAFFQAVAEANRGRPSDKDVDFLMGAGGIASKIATEINKWLKGGELSDETVQQMHEMSVKQLEYLEDRIGELGSLAAQHVATSTYPWPQHWRDRFKERAYGEVTGAYDAEGFEPPEPMDTGGTSVNMSTSTRRSQRGSAAETLPPMQGAGPKPKNLRKGTLDILGGP